MLQKKDIPTTTKIPTTPTKTNATKEGIPTTTKIPTTPTKTNATKEGVPTTPTTIKKPIVENQTSVKPKLMLQKKDYQQHHKNNYKEDTNNTNKN